MNPVSVVRRVKIKAGKRAFKMLANQAIGNDLLKGLLELITNADESYARLETTGQKTSGRIEIEVDRRPRKKRSIIRVIDWAEGMDEAQLVKCVGGYGEDTSGQVGRGIFGMGLKDTIIGFGGEGVITSFKSGYKYVCQVTNVDDLDIEKPRPVTRADKAKFRNTEGGTIIEIEVTNPDIKMPQIDSLRQLLQTHVCLRGIMTDPERIVTLRDLKRGSKDELRYSDPEGEVLVDGFQLGLPSYPNANAMLTVRKAIGPEVLLQSGSSRTGGILIISRRTYHESTLFGFDEDPYAARLFGELRCDEIYDRQAAGEPIVDKNREGLKKNHPFTKELFEAARGKVEDLVALEREKEKQRQRKLEDESTVRRFKEAVKSLNEIARRELQAGGPGFGDSTFEASELRAPRDGFEFIPDSYRILVAERAPLSLRIQVDGTTGIAVGDKVEVSCDNTNIRVLENAPIVGKLFSEEPPMSTLRITVEGLQANAQGFVMATCNGLTAIAAVEVVSTKTQREHHPSGGLFKEIRYEEKEDYPVPARFDRNERIMYINTLGPGVDLYFGKDGEGQELPANQVLVADLVTDLASQEIGRGKREKKSLDIPPGVDPFEAYSSYVTSLKSKVAPAIHKLLVDRANRRK